MQIDTDRWHRLRRAEADAADDGPSVLQVQDANDRRARVRDELARFKASGPQGQATGRPTARAHAGVEIRPGIGGHDPEDVTRAFEAGVRALQAQVPTMGSGSKARDLYQISMVFTLKRRRFSGIAPRES